MNLIKKNDIFLLEEIVKKNFSSKYKDSVLGIFWTILSPLLIMVLFTIIFSTLFKQKIENYPIYFLSGWCLYIFFSTSIATSMDSLRGNKNILQKTPAPKYIFILGSVISEFLNLLIMMILFVIIMIITHTQFHWPTMFLAIIPIFTLFIMMIGLGLILSIVAVYYSDIRYLWSILTLMFLYSSATFYPMEIIPEPFRTYLCLNPLYWAIYQFRCFVYYGVMPDVLNFINFILLSLIILLFGIIIFKRYKNVITLKL